MTVIDSLTEDCRQAGVAPDLPVGPREEIQERRETAAKSVNPAVQTDRFI